MGMTAPRTASFKPVTVRRKANRLQFAHWQSLESSLGPINSQDIVNRWQQKIGAVSRFPKCLTV